MKTRLLMLSVLFAMTSILFAQNANEILKFEERVHDFGEINEVDGRATAVFDFENVSGKAVTLTAVQASCGCTTPEWTREPLAPSKKGFIKVTYNPAGRPGNFTKSVTVRFMVAGETQAKTIVLNIKGSVIPKPKVQKK